ncbi:MULTISPECIES: amidohydrolase family protein [unclassified Mesorhizobium]|uniref:amidohydrolase family protein n=1 Tax=unclassified Mesorhizobium TaxID=325217 RepID=UPI000FD7A5E4|nr:MULTISPECIES: amidohydrolase family protein [unclassified Mesorhizobium]TGT71937.1 amidohydrolase [Mesorhizobium sp. M2E.F.Ca.ET.166.01.1.1]TGV99348.1 amidohydrolase [Mesorhizobium sp. M2E.F.Ca.ET.154.01.1.1]
MVARIRSVIDCDIHPAVPGTAALMPFMDEYWQEQFRNRGIDGLELASYPPNSPLACRPDWRTPGEKPGLSLERCRKDALDMFAVEFAICNPLYGGHVAMSDLMAAALCTATNKWMAQEWLDREPRLRASIVIPTQNPELAVEEIERCASDHRFVQVLLLAGNELTLGKNRYWPIYKAAQRHGLPIGIHAGSMYRYPTTSCGWPSTFTQDYAHGTQLFSAQLQSLIMEGVFGKFPDLTFVMIESGVGWVPSYLWRVTKTWRGIRGEVPWVKRSPSAEVRDRVRFTIQPFDGPTNAEDVERFVNQLGSEDMLLFSSDYPHWQFDGDNPMPEGIPARLHQIITRENPLKTYARLKG